MKNMKLAFIIIFLILAVTVLAYNVYIGKNVSDESAAEQSTAACDGAATQDLSGSNAAYAGAQELISAADFKAAAEKLETAMKEYPGEARLYNLLGQALMYKKDFDRSVAAFQKAVAFEPGNINYIFDLSAIQFKIEKFEDAALTIEAVDVKTVADPMQAVLAVNICVQNLLPEPGIRWSDRALTLLTPETETYNFILTRKALFLSMLGGSEESLRIMDKIKFDPQNEDKQFLQATLKAGFIRWLNRKPGEREKMFSDLLVNTPNEFAADTIRLSQSLAAMEGSKWSEAASFLKKDLPEPAASDSVTKVFHYLMRQGINVIALDKTGHAEEAKSLIDKMKKWCDANSKGGGRVLLARCQSIDLLSKKNVAKEAIDICLKMPPSIIPACLINAGFGSEMNGDDDSAWELYSKSAENARYNAFPRKISRVLLRNINESRKAANEDSR